MEVAPSTSAASNKEVVKSLQLNFGVLPINADGDTIENLTETVRQKLINELHLKKGDKIIVKGGYPFKKVKYTNFMQIDEI